MLHVDDALAAVEFGRRQHREQLGVLDQEIGIALEEAHHLAGAKPRRSYVSGRDALTASELRVAELAAAGQTSAQIAQALFVTTKTIDAHLQHAYSKLNIHSRRELAAALTNHPEAATKDR